MTNSPDEEEFRDEALPIGGTEEPERMFWQHRADYVPRALGLNYTHYNKPGSGEWNKLWICFLPAEWPEGTKTQNVYLKSKVNEDEEAYGGVIFDGELKTGTRSARRIVNTEVPARSQDPERDVYVDEAPESDKRIRILGHWGSTVQFRNVKIRSLGSED